MPKPRKRLRFTYSPPRKIGWWAYSHNRGPAEAVYLGQESLANARDRFELATAVEIEPADIWSTRRLKKRERGKECK